MRISDWSSDVCSSDLMTILPEGVANVFRKDGHVAILRVGEAQHDASAHLLELRDLRVGEGEVDELHRGSLAVCGGAVDVLLGRADDALAIDRSEEHTSELQSLMRISYAVFCLKTKKTTND